MPSLEFPWPPPKLMPNAKRRLHWTRYREPIRAAEMLGFGLILQAGLKAPEGDTFAYSLELTPPKRGGPIPDEDNILGACKHYLDGIARGLRVNDRTFRLQAIKWNPKAGDGKVIIRF